MSLISDQTRYQPGRPTYRIEEHSQPWTTARCYRILRPLVSRIASLRKDASIASQATVSTLRSTSGTVPVSSVRSSGHCEESDAESGLLMPRKKRPRLTYSQRRGTKPQSQHSGLDHSHSRQDSYNENISLAAGTKPGVKKAFGGIQAERQKATAPGEIVPSTPILRRARARIVPSPVAPVHESDPNQARLGRTKVNSSAQKRLDERLAKLRECLPSKYADLEAIYRSLEALLKATAVSTLGDMNGASGPRSFLDICLRKVPQYIIELEAWERLEAEQSGTVSTLDDINTSAQIYNDLESLGTNVGWRHLRVVVRADGLNAVKQTIEEGLFDGAFSQLIIDLCVQLGAASEAEDLVAALIDHRYPQPTSTESRFTQGSALQPLVILNYFAAQTGRTSFLFRQYSMLLSSGGLPTDWLATTEFERIWSLAVEGLANHKPSYDAMRFITQSILLLSCHKRTFNYNADAVRLEQDMRKASQRTLMSALSILASMSLLEEAGLEAPRLLESDTRQITIIGDRFRYVIRACIHGLDGSARNRDTQRLEYLYLVLFLSSVQGHDEKIGILVEECIGKLPPPVATALSTKNIRTRNHYDNIAWLIASIARACGRATSVASHQCLNGLFKRLESLKLSQNLLDNLKAAAAFLIAERTNNVRDLIYAESLHPHVGLSSGATKHQQGGSTLFTGYRWEESIGEWVTVSPVMNKRGAPTKEYLRSSTPVKDMETFMACSSNLASPVTDNLQGAEADLSQRLDDDEYDTKGCIHNTCDGQSMMMKKRPRRLRSTETLTTTLATKALLPQRSLAISAPPRPPKSHVDPEKENRVRLLAKKPRRSSGRVILGARQLSRDFIRRRDSWSDDELCI
ncbi:hypothetical protein E0Z10_g6118 [Xylaria hypoxylon]|uniref:Uncharacterized protein n=1 Tax=Xylaria hypoxylon TaxID=37992 RepID=A0A4Z0YU41_9PEZI|nr:hypothetical protein E0Z10_g6118 [Xylaria hypoxylon]